MNTIKWFMEESRYYQTRRHGGWGDACAVAMIYDPLSVAIAFRAAMKLRRRGLAVWMCEGSIKRQFKRAETERCRFAVVCKDARLTQVKDLMFGGAVLPRQLNKADAS